MFYVLVKQVNSKTNLFYCDTGGYIMDFIIFWILFWSFMLTIVWCWGAKF